MKSDSVAFLEKSDAEVEKLGASLKDQTRKAKKKKNKCAVFCL